MLLYVEISIVGIMLVLGVLIASIGNLIHIQIIQLMDKLGIVFVRVLDVYQNKKLINKQLNIRILYNYYFIRFNIKNY